jgi:hypothetical protein
MIKKNNINIKKDEKKYAMLTFANKKVNMKL